MRLGRGFAALFSVVFSLGAGATMTSAGVLTYDCSFVKGNPLAHPHDGVGADAGSCQVSGMVCTMAKCSIADTFDIKCDPASSIIPAGRFAQARFSAVGLHLHLVDPAGSGASLLVLGQKKRPGRFESQLSIGSEARVERSLRGSCLFEDVGAVVDL